MKKSIASQVALAILAGASTQVSFAAPTTAVTAVPAMQTSSHHACSQKPGGTNCELEKCYGISQKSMNDCGNSRHACAGQATANNQGDEWINVAKGNCLRISGGSLTPIAADASGTSANTGTSSGSDASSSSNASSDQDSSDEDDASGDDDDSSTEDNS